MTTVSNIGLLLLWLTVFVFSQEATKGKLAGRTKDVLTVPACHLDFTRIGDWCYYNSANPGYLSVYGKTTYDGAVEICRQMGGDLLSIHNAEENTAMHQFANETLIGLRYNGNQFVWSDSTPYNFSKADPSFVTLSGYLGFCSKMGVPYWENAECDLSELSFTCKMLPTLYPNTVCPDSNALYLDSGTISSPGYPLYYVSNHANCQYMIAGMNGRKIEITFERYYLNYGSAGNDTVIVYEGLTTSVPLGWIDRNSRGTITFTTQRTNRMLLNFASNSGYRGFWTATFRSI